MHAWLSVCLFVIFCFAGFKNNDTKITVTGGSSIWWKWSRRPLPQKMRPEFQKKEMRPLQPRRRRGEEDVGESNSCSTSSSPFLRSHYNRDICISFNFTLPGGSRSAGDGSGGGVAGTPVLGGPRRSYAFDAFILADALAFGFSLLATSILLYAGVPAGSLDNRFRLINYLILHTAWCGNLEGACWLRLAWGSSWSCFQLPAPLQLRSLSWWLFLQLPSLRNPKASILWVTFLWLELAEVDNCHHGTEC